MPLPADVLAAWMSSEIELPEGAPGQPGPLTLPPASVTPRPPAPLALTPQAWFIAAARPVNALPDPEEDQRRHAAFTRAVQQAGLVALPARLTGLGLDGLMVLGVDREKAVQLAYKRRQWAVLGVFRDRVEVVYTGLNSREA